MKKYKETFIVKSQFSDGLRTFPKGTIFESTGVFLALKHFFVFTIPMEFLMIVYIMAIVLK